MQIADSILLIEGFRGGSLRNTLSTLEHHFAGLHGSETSNQVAAEKINTHLIEAAFQVKKSSAQIDVIIHSVGILLALPYLLNESEVTEALSLGAGNTGKDFDLVTNQRIAEFKFIQWQGGPESIRQNSIFKDFYYLAEHDTSKSRYLYLLETERPLRFFTGRRILTSVLSRNQRLRDNFRDKYGDRFKVVQEYFEFRRSMVEIVDLRSTVAGLADILLKLQSP